MNTTQQTTFLRAGWMSALLASAAIAVPAATQVARAQDIEPLRVAASAAPSDSQAQRAYGDALLEAGRFAEAQTQMQKVVRLEKDSPQARYDLARVKLAQDDYQGARKACQEILKAAPEHVIGHVCMARAFLVWRRSSRAVEHVDAAIARDPEHYEALLVDADTRRMEGALDEALTAYQKVLDKHPRSADAWLGKALVHELRNQPAEAEAALRNALQHKPSHPEALLALGKIAQGVEAIGLLERAVAARPASSDAKLALAAAKINAGDAKGAEPMLRSLIAKQKDNLAATAQLGAALVELGSYPEAEKLLRGVLERMPNDFDAAFALATLFERTGKHEEAFTHYRNAADLKRESTRALLAAARLGVRLGRPLLAGALLDRALERAPRSAEVHALYGDLMVARGESEGAKAHYQKALGGEGPVDRARVQKELAKLK